MPWLTLSLLLLILPVPAGAQDNFGETRQYFGDWLAACRPDGYCSATAYDNPNPPSSYVADNVLRVGRHPEGLYWEVSISTVANLAAERARFTIATDTETFDFTVPETAGAYLAINDFYFLGEGARGLIDAMVAGSGISVTFTDEAGSRQTADFSLSGLAASLLWIDEQQGRVGSERVAFAPPVGLEPVGARAVTVPDALLAIHLNNPACGPFDFVDPLRDVIKAEMDENTTIWFLSCTWGAYNFSHAAYQSYRDQDFYPLYFVDYSDRFGWSGTGQLVNMWYDLDTKQVRSFAKGRGLADCGTSGLWEWDEYAFRLLEFYAKDECDGEGEPGDFPLVYRAKPASGG